MEMTFHSLRVDGYAVFVVRKIMVKGENSRTVTDC